MKRERKVPIQTKAVEAGILSPAELVLLNGVFHATAVEGETDREREARASRILGYYIAGITDEVELRTLAKQALGR
jgi:hypothetical protein